MLPILNYSYFFQPYEFVEIEEGEKKRHGLTNCCKAVETF